MSAASSSHTIVSDNARVGVEPIDYEEYVSNHSERRDDCNEVEYLYLSMYLSIYLSFYLSIYSSTYLFIYLSIYLSFMEQL